MFRFFRFLRFEKWIYVKSRSYEFCWRKIKVVENVKLSSALRAPSCHLAAPAAGTWRKLLKKLIEFGPKFEEKSLKIKGSRGTFEVLGDPLGAKMAQDAIWSASGAPFGWLLGRILAPKWAKMVPSWPTCVQDGQLGGQDGQLGALLGASWRPFLDLGA